MSRAALLGATLIVTLLAPNGRIAGANESTQTIVFEWNQVLQDTIPSTDIRRESRVRARLC